MTKQRWDNYEDHVKEFGLIPLTDNQIQRILDVEIEHFQVRMPEFKIVPFVENDEGKFLKTIIPSRKATRDYLGGKK